MARFPTSSSRVCCAIFVFGQFWNFSELKTIAVPILVFNSDDFYSMKLQSHTPNSNTCARAPPAISIDLNPRICDTSHFRHNKVGWRTYLFDQSVARLDEYLSRAWSIAGGQVEPGVSESKQRKRKLINLVAVVNVEYFRIKL